MTMLFSRGHRFFLWFPYLCLLASACAKAPETIAPAYQPAFLYRDLTCTQIDEEHQRTAVALAAASEQQNNARNNDIVGVLLIGIPVSSLSGDNIAPQIAQLKGQQQALSQARLEKKCHGGMTLQR